MEALDAVPLWLVGLGLFALLASACWAGRQWRTHVARDEGNGDASLVISASLGLLALLIGFTFSLVVNRHEQRAAELVMEASAIESLWQRLDFLPPAPRAELHDTLKKYVDARVRVSRIGENRADAEAATQEGLRLADSIWNGLVVAEPLIERESTLDFLVVAATEMMRVAAARDAALSARVPAPVLLLLLVFPLSSAVMIGFVYGKRPGLHTKASVELLILLTLTILLIVDLDRPRSGLVLNSQAPLEQIQARIGAGL